MTSFTRSIRPHVDAELQAADRALAEDDATRAFVHLERAHVLGQASTIEHVRVHARMLYWGFVQRNLREVLGQLLRVAGAATKTAFRPGAARQYRRRRRQPVPMHADSARPRRAN